MCIHTYIYIYIYIVAGDRVDALILEVLDRVRLGFIARCLVIYVLSFMLLFLVCVLFLRPGLAYNMLVSCYVMYVVLLLLFAEGHRGPGGI